MILDIQKPVTPCKWECGSSDAGTRYSQKPPKRAEDRVSNKTDVPHTCLQTDNTAAPEPCPQVNLQRVDVVQQDEQYHLYTEKNMTTLSSSG